VRDCKHQSTTTVLYIFALAQYYTNKMLSYRRETELQGTLVLAERGRLELGDNILLIL